MQVGNEEATNLYAVILAAGSGTRAGGPKALLKLPDGRSFLDLAIERSRVVTSGVVVVLGPWAAGGSIEDAVVVINPEPDRGQIYSLRLGIAALPRNATGAFIVLVDQPWVRPATFEKVVSAHYSSPHSIVVPIVNIDGLRRRGHPVVFPRWLFDELNGQTAENGGARAVIRSHIDRVLEVEVEDRGVVMDIDTQVDYLLFQQSFDEKG